MIAIALFADDRGTGLASSESQRPLFSHAVTLVTVSYLFTKPACLHVCLLMGISRCSSHVFPHLTITEAGFFGDDGALLGANLKLILAIVGWVSVTMVPTFGIMKILKVSVVRVRVRVSFSRSA